MLPEASSEGLGRQVSNVHPKKQLLQGSLELIYQCPDIHRELFACNDLTLKMEIWLDFSKGDG